MKMNTKLFQLILPLTVFLFTACGDSEKQDEQNGNDTNTDTEVKSEMEELDYSDMSMCDFNMDQVDLPYKMMLPIKTIGERPNIVHNEEVTWHIKLNEKFHLTIDDWGKEEKTISKMKEQLTLDNGVFDMVVNSEDEDELVYTLNGKKETDIGGFNHFCLIKEIDGTYFTIQSHYFGAFSLSRVNDMLRAAKSFQSAKEES